MNMSETSLKQQVKMIHAFVNSRSSNTAGAVLFIKLLNPSQAKASFEHMFVVFHSGERLFMADSFEPSNRCISRAPSLRELSRERFVNAVDLFVSPGDDWNTKRIDAYLYLSGLSAEEFSRLPAVRKQKKDQSPFCCFTYLCSLRTSEQEKF